ncbi:MAG: GNAT family N-acetyltransferase [Desulfurococcales archaeon]|nr:GNAT family N-acetyltransferase [Desulfurococcales archaeon]
MRIIVGYQGGSLDQELVRVYNSCMSIRGFAADRTMSVDEIRRLWFEYSTFDPEEFAIAVDNNRVYGMVFARVPGWIGWIWLCIDPSLPQYYLLETLYSLLSWARYRLACKRVCVARINCGYEYSQLYNMLRGIIGLGVEATTVTLMEYKAEFLEPMVRQDIVVRKGSLDDIPGVVEVWNKAFRKYSWFEEWSIDDAIKWYTSRKLLLYIAIDRETDKIVGYVDAEKRLGFDGNLYGYIYTLAVHPETQGRGIGKHYYNT